MEILQSISFDEKEVIKRSDVEFIIKGDAIDYEIISSDVKIKPTRAWNKGDIYIVNRYNPNTKTKESITKERSSGIWTIGTGNDEQYRSINKSIEYLLSILEPYKNKIFEYKAIYEICLYIYIEINGENGGYEINANNLAAISQMCTYVDFRFVSNN